MKHLSSSHADPACRICCRAETLRLVVLVPFEVAVYWSHGNANAESSGA